MSNLQVLKPIVMQRLFITALACCVLFVSCNPDEELTENGDVFIGTWQCLGYLNSDGEEYPNDPNDPTDPCSYQANFIVESDGNLIFTFSNSDFIEDNGTFSYSGDCVTVIVVGQADIINETIMNLTWPNPSSNNGFNVSVAEITSEGVLRWMPQWVGSNFDGYDVYYEKIN